VTLTPTQKLYAAALAIGALGYWKARRDRNSLIGACASGATGPTACGGDVPVEGNQAGTGGAVGGIFDAIARTLGGWWSGIPARGNTGQQDPSHEARAGDYPIPDDDRPIGGGIIWGSQGPNTEWGW
jgi:hypothetical protein